MVDNVIVSDDGDAQDASREQFSRPPEIRPVDVHNGYALAAQQPPCANEAARIREEISWFRKRTPYHISKIKAPELRLDRTWMRKEQERPQLCAIDKRQYCEQDSARPSPIAGARGKETDDRCSGVTRGLSMA